MELNKILNINYFLNKKNSLLLVLTNSFLIAILSLTIISCNNNPVEPKDNAQPGSRDYVWTVDTLWTEDWFVITDIWGSSPNSIWMVAGGYTSHDCLWYYDGVNWKRFNQRLRRSDLSCVFGLSPDDVWIGNAMGII